MSGLIDFGSDYVSIVEYLWTAAKWPVVTHD